MGMGRKKGEKAMDDKKRTVVEVPDDLHHAVKVYAVVHGIPVKEIVAEALRRHLAKLETREGGKKE
jgi:hypothetical protein